MTSERARSFLGCSIKTAKVDVKTVTTVINTVIKTVKTVIITVIITVKTVKTAITTVKSVKSSQDSQGTWARRVDVREAAQLPGMLQRDRPEVPAGWRVLG